MERMADGKSISVMTGFSANHIQTDSPQLYLDVPVLYNRHNSTEEDSLQTWSAMLLIANVILSIEELNIALKLEDLRMY